jgi:ankyrin repeat protein
VTAFEEEVHALMRAAFEGNMAALLGLLDADRSLVWDSRNGVTALHLAAFAGHRDAVDLLLLKGADIDASTGEGTPLFQAAWSGQEAVVEYLLSHGADARLTTRSGETPLMAAAAKGYVAIGRRLIEAGADVNARTTNGTTDFFTGSPPVCGESALHLAAAYGHVEFVNLLLESGADVKIEDDCGQRPAHWAARHLQEEVVALLQGASI